MLIPEIFHHAAKDGATCLLERCQLKSLNYDFDDGPNHWLEAWLPDGFFQTKNPTLGKYRRALARKMFDIFYGHFTDIGIFFAFWYILCSHGTFFPGFGNMYQEKSGNPGLGRMQRFKRIKDVYLAVESSATHAERQEKNNLGYHS
jgi:hypothetical protein